MHLYSRIVHSLLDRSLLKNTDSVLVLAGGNFDRQTMLDAKLTNVTISNLEYHAGHDDYTPYDWKHLDAESIEEEDNSYDWVMIHAGLHHLAVPASGVGEMLRVARKGILCLEARDSLLMKFAVKIGVTSDYELEPAFLSGGSSGGYRNGPIPNYVYRWTEREFEKVVNTYAPAYRHKFFYGYGFQAPVKRFAMHRNRLIRLMGFVVSKLTRAAEIIIPKQGNQFAFGVLKNSNIQPWLDSDLRFKENFFSKKYDKAKYKKTA